MIRFGFEPMVEVLFLYSVCQSEMPSLAAIPERVSPDFTVYVPLAELEDELLLVSELVEAAGAVSEDELELESEEPEPPVLVPE